MKYCFLLLLLTFALFVSGQSTKEPSLEHFTMDGYELTKYIKVSETPYLMNKLTEFKKFHHTGYTNYTKERITCKEDDIPGYILRKERYFDWDKMENIDDTRYYYNSKAIDIIYDYLSKFGYSYFDHEIIRDLKWNDKEIKESCAKTIQRYDRKTCPNCNGESRFIDNSDKYSTESRSVMQNCIICDRTFQFTVWNWNGSGWKNHHKKKPGYVKCECLGYGFTETYHLGSDPTRKNCHISGCNNGWKECYNCSGKGQVKGSVSWEKKHVTTPKNECTRCNNSGEVNTGEIKTYTCSSCNGKGYTFKRIRNPEWENIEIYYRENKILYTKIFSKYNGRMRPDGFRVDSWEESVRVEADRGYAFLGKEKYLTLNKKYSSTGELKYHNLDFVQIAFQRNLKDSRQVSETTSSAVNNKYDTNIQKTTSGTYTFADGSKYVGEWKDGEPHVPHGQGTYTWVSGNKYVGEWKDGNQHGQGTKTWTNGSKYVGEYMDGKKSGQGTNTFADGSKYVGEWKDGNQHGQGTYTWTDGSKYVGEWKYGKRSGQGTDN